MARHRVLGLRFSAPEGGVIRCATRCLCHPSGRMLAGVPLIRKDHPMSEPEQINPTSDWRNHGVRVIKGDQLDPNTPQTPGMRREAAINYARVGAQKIWAGTVK